MQYALRKWLTFLGIGLCTLLVFSTITISLHSSFIPVKEKQSLSKTALAQFVTLPLNFEINKGQADTSVKYLTRGPGYHFYFTPQEIVMVLQRGLQDKITSSSTVLKMQFLGANPHACVIGKDEQIGKSNYFIGQDPKQWYTHISHYAKILYPNLYPGIDAVFYGNPQQLEYDLCIAPGTNPQDIHLRIEGTQELSIDVDGNLHILTKDLQDVQMQKPFVYQTIDDKQITVEGKFVLLAKNEISFELGLYDKNQTVVIDPILVYSTYLGGSGADSGANIVVDSSGNAYVTGVTNSIDFPITTGAFQTASMSGGSNAFVTKLNSLGSALIYSTYLGGNNGDSGSSITIDSSGNAFITGTTGSTNFPVTPGALQTAFAGIGAGSQNAFITKLDPTGSTLVYSTYLGGSNTDAGNSITIDTTGNAFVTGLTSSTNFPITAGVFQPVFAGTGMFSQNAFVTKLNPTGSTLVYSTYLGGSSMDQGNGIAIDSFGNAYITGQTTSVNFPFTTGAFQPALLSASGNAFITKLDSVGSALVYSTFLGGSGVDQGSSIAIDSDTNAYITGSTSSANFPSTPGAFRTALAGSTDAFVTKLNPTGSALVYSTYLGGSSLDQANDITIDSSMNAYVTGSTLSTNFPVTADAFQDTLHVGAGINAFVTKFNPTGTALLYSTYLGGSATDEGSGIALDNSNNIYVTGLAGSTNFPTTTGAFQTALKGASNAFITKFLFSPPVIIGISPNLGPQTGNTAVTITGVNFTGATSVHFGTTAVPFLVVSDTQITAVTSPGMDIVDVTVTTPIGTSAITMNDQFTFQTPGIITDLLPPINLVGFQRANRFATQTDYINVLTWQPPIRGTLPVAYRIYRDEALTEFVAEVSANRKLRFKDHNRKKGKTYTYFISSVDQLGNFSSPAQVNVKGR